ncbi:glycosyltransferase [uncultured Chryseobacterium sp.]|uniref:glycosyltransferase n=1 Tax=uncultured Chryseobacterium sp. TaxID=259322 RepID=UPI0026110D46|nr:glycosyltransferase [uncultured Chryseobacterium sp.]
MNPLVTIVIPIYKVEKFIERCLLSVVKQSYKEIECILVNDVSPDNSMVVADTFINQHPDFNFKIINQPQNLGLSMARNAGMDLAKGKYIYFLDSDDEITEFAIEHLVKLAEETDAEMVLGHSVCINEEEGWKRDYFPIKAEKDVLTGNREIFENLVAGQFPVMACDKLTRLDFLLEHELYFVKDLFSQDVLWTFQCAQKMQKIAFLREDTYLYYFHGASIIHNRGEKHFGNWITIAQYMDKAYREEKYPYMKDLILKHLVGFKAQTLEMNWKAKKNEHLWKRSYSEYQKLKSLEMKDYFSKKFTKKLKKQNLFNSLPVGLGFKVFKWRYQR